MVLFLHIFLVLSWRALFLYGIYDRCLGDFLIRFMQRTTNELI